MVKPKVCEKVEKLYKELEERIQNVPIKEIKNIEIWDGDAVLWIHHHVYGYQIIIDEHVYDKEGNKIGVAFPSCTKQLKLLRKLKKMLNDIEKKEKGGDMNE